MYSLLHIDQTITLGDNEATLPPQPKGQAPNSSIKICALKTFDQEFWMYSEVNSKTDNSTAIEPNPRATIGWGKGPLELHTSCSLIPGCILIPTPQVISFLFAWSSLRDHMHIPPSKILATPTKIKSTSLNDTHLLIYLDCMSFCTIITFLHCLSFPGNIHVHVLLAG